jgi:hypothetical protein
MGNVISRTLERISASHWRRSLLLACGTLVLLAALRARTIPLTPAHPEFNNPWDHHKYIWMALHDPFGFGVAPFCWRIGTPLLAYLLPFKVETNFAIITFVSLWLTGIAVYFIARRLSFSYWAALSGALLYYTQGWFVRADLFNIWKPDPAAVSISLYAVLCILRRNDWAYALLLAVGVLFKESVLFVAPLYYSLNTDRPWNPRLALRTVDLAIPAIVVLLILRALIPMRNYDPAYIAQLPQVLSQVQLGTSAYSVIWLWHNIGIQRLRSFSLDDVWSATVGVFGFVAVVLPLLSVRRTASLLLRWLPFLLLVGLQAFFATNAQRLLAIGFPVVLLASLGGANWIVDRFHLHWASFAVFCLALVGVSLLRTWIVVVPLPYQVLLLASYLLLCATWYFTWGRNHTPSFNQRDR